MEEIYHALTKDIITYQDVKPFENTSRDMALQFKSFIKSEEDY